MKAFFHKACVPGRSLMTLFTVVATATRLPDVHHYAGSNALRLALMWMMGLGLGLSLMACGPAPRTSQGQPAAVLSVAPPPAPKTLESTLQLDPGIEEIPFYPQIATSTHGDTVAVWEQFDGERYNIWANSRRAHQDWGRARLIQASETGHSYNPRVAINALGQAAAVWVQMDSARGNYTLWSTHVMPGADWTPPVPLEAGNRGPAYAPNVVIDETGNAFAAWQRSNGRNVDVRASRFVAGVGWGPARLLGRADGSLGAAQLAVDSDGTALVVWPRFQAGRSALWASRYTVAARADEWDRAVQIDSVLGYAHAAQLIARAGAMRGEFTVRWEEQEQEGLQAGVRTSHYEPGRPWRTDGPACARLPQVVDMASPGKAASSGRAQAARSVGSAAAHACF